MSVLKSVLPLHAQRYPTMEVRDYVKLLYQSEFGPGHLVALEGLQAELAQAGEEDYRPQYLSEAIGGGLCRFHLDPRLLTEEELPLLARCFALSARPRGTMTGLWRKLGELSAKTQVVGDVNEETANKFLLAVDAAFTIRNLVLVAMHVESVTQLGQELQLQAALGKAELSDRLEDGAAALRQRYSDQVAQLEKYSRRFRHVYSSLKVSQKYSVSHEDILAAAALAKEELLRHKDAFKFRAKR